MLLRLEPFSEDIIKEYISGETMQDISEKYLGDKSKWDGIRRFLVSKDIKIRSKSEVKRLMDEKQGNEVGLNGRKYTLNFDYFKTWSKNMAYILGFIASDGNVCNNRLRISVNIRDKDVLEKIKDELEYTGVISDTITRCKGKEFPVSTITIVSKSLCSDLKELNIVENKSLILNLDGVIPDEYKIDFIRGYFDGDGSIGYMYPTNSRGKRSETAQIRFRICSGSESILKLIVDEFERLGIKRVNIHNSKNKTLYNIEYSTKSALEIYKIIYYEGAMFLNRKKNKFDEIIEMRNNDINNKQ